MIPILYDASALDFSSYGIGALTDTVSCKVTEERNGIFECTFKYPVNGIRYEAIKTERIVKVKPNDTANDQAFRIYRITTPLKGIVTVYAQHISYDLANIATMPIEPFEANAAQAMERVYNGALRAHSFTFSTEYDGTKTYRIDKPRSIRSCIGGEAGSLIDLWGGELEWDNFLLRHRQHRGHDTGVVIEYGKNITDFEHDVGNENVYSELLPYAVRTEEDESETVITLNECVLRFSTVLQNNKTLIKDFTDSFEQGEDITEEKLRAKANRYIQNNPLGIEQPSITVSFEPLWQQAEYAAVLERVSLCDTLTVRVSALGISLKTKVVKYTYDVLAEKYTSITLGASKGSLADTVAQTTAELETATQKVSRFPALLQTAISSATKTITGQNGGYVVLHGDPNTGQPYELLVMDAPSIANAVNVWRWNVGGLGFSSSGYNGPYETAITADGKIVADFITAGTLAANIIKAGVLSSLDGSSYWNLETGEVVLRSYATTTSLTETNDRIDEINAQKMYRLVITSSNGNIFKNGNISTTLSATVFSWDENVTDTLDPNQFIWTRVSDNAEADRAWNSAHFGGTKSIQITSDDVHVRATFFCDLIDTTTRRSLLG